MDITGIIIKKLPVQSGTSANGPWQKQDFVIQTEDQYPKQVCFSLWGQRVDDLSRYNENERVRVFFDVSSREYNERWYTDLRAWRIESADAATPPPPPAGQTYNPAPAAPATPSAPAADSNAGEDDLPF